MELIFDFAKFTEVTALAFKVNPLYEENNYSRLFVCCDTHVFWIARIMPDTDENFEHCKGSYVVEREQIDKPSKAKNLSAISAAKLLKDDDFCNWDCDCYQSLEAAIEAIDGGFGINNLVEQTADSEG